MHFKSFVILATSLATLSTAIAIDKTVVSPINTVAAPVDSVAAPVDTNVAPADAPVNTLIDPVDKTTVPGTEPTLQALEDPITDENTDEDSDDVLDHCTNTDTTIVESVRDQLGDDSIDAGDITVNLAAPEDSAPYGGKSTSCELLNMLREFYSSLKSDKTTYSVRRPQEDDDN
ncbi:hypothetical protein C0993_006437 [Termitomyces sp. T159_Od127]|nr:hypothetical protein C0993_006437 [Termitomyces sp. T159_Od127]